MVQKALVLVFVVAGIISSISCGNSTSHYVYATVPAANQIFAYREDPNTGILTLLSGSPYPAGDGATSAVLHPSGKFLYAANPGQTEYDISLFAIASDGVLTEITPRTPVGVNASQPSFLAMDPGGSYLYVANTKSNNISVFSIDSNGTLTQLANSPFVVGLTPLNMQVTPSGNFLYVTTSGVSDGNGFIFGFSVNAGVLTSLGAPSSSFGEIPNGLAIGPSGAYLYAANAGSSNTIAVFSIAASGALSLLQAPQALPPGVSDPNSLILDSKGAYLYVANEGSSNVVVYSISSSTGLPVLTSTSNGGIGTFFTESNPSFLATDPNGGYLFVGSQGTGAGIEAFSVSSGNLTDIFTYRVGNTASSIVVLQ
jgi:6-phosphogluconolactonase (cycloisomerase 2 family)